MKFSEYRTMKFARRGRVLEIIFNRPEQLNSVNSEAHEELAQVFVDADRDPDSDVIVLTGEGRAFSAGGDIEGMRKKLDGPSTFHKTLREGKQIIFSLLDCEKPVIAKVNGHAMGLGATIALFCDVIFVADTAKIGDPHVRVGLVAGDGGAVIWPQLIGYARQGAPDDRRCAHRYRGGSHRACQPRGAGSRTGRPGRGVCRPARRRCDQGDPLEQGVREHRPQAACTLDHGYLAFL